MKKVVFLAIFGTASMFAHAQTIRYVTPNGTGNGTSWQDASSDLQAMMNDLTSIGNGEVWVAAGTYVPFRRADSAMYNHVSTPDDSRNAFVLNTNAAVAVYGGFVGNESRRDQRNWAENPTILEGRMPN